MPKALVFYHYLYPDDVVSAVHVSELCEELVRRGWDVTAMPCNRSCRDKFPKHPARERWKGVEIRRIWRPALSQASTLGRFANAIWMVCRWSTAALRHSPDFIIVGTDPVLSVTVARVWKLLRPHTRVAHWCFDLYPEAAVADGILRPDGWFLATLKPVLRNAYGRCDLLADIGSCMGARLRSYQPRGRQVTLTPWALSEPARPLAIDQHERMMIFGDAQLALLYSGNFGRAHSSSLILQLARRLAPHEVQLTFSVRGNRADALRQAAASVPNVRFVPFAAQGDLEARLSAADIQVVSLDADWTGTVVPSKFFGALAVGRPVLFAGSPESAVAKWILVHQVGWVLTESNLESVANELLRCAQASGEMARLFEHCHAVYNKHFSKRWVADQWDAELRRMLPGSNPGRP
ncbi:MAG: glycosyltransferase family 4 protein [Bryobacteraceae bacterium]